MEKRERVISLVTLEIFVPHYFVITPNLPGIIVGTDERVKSLRSMEGDLVSTPLKIEFSGCPAPVWMAVGEIALV